MEKEYDIKYAIAVLDKHNRLSFYPYKKEDMVGYVISKVFVVSEETKYNENGEYNVYDVVLPYNNLGSQRDYPFFVEDGNSVYSTRIYRVFDSYDEAKEEVDKLNESLKYQALADVYKTKTIFLTHQDKIEEASKLFKQRLNKCHIFESILDEYTKDLKVKSRQPILR